MSENEGQVLNCSVHVSDMMSHKKRTTAQVHTVYRIVLKMNKSHMT